MPVNGPFKDQLMGALHTAVQYFNESPEDPNGSVVKAAQEHNFNAEQATRLVETFNTARTIYHYKSAADRTAQFALADSGAVIPAMFAPDAKVAVAPDTDFDYSCYDVPEAHYEDGMMLDKTAVQEVDLGEPREYGDSSLEIQAERACKVMYVQRDLASTARDESRVAGTKSAQLLTKLAATLSLGYEEECKDQYSRLIGGYANDAEYGPVIAKLAEFVPEHLHADPCTDSVVEDRDLSAHIETVKEARSWMEAEAEMLAYAGQLEKEAAAFEREWMEAISPAMPKPEVQTVADFINPGLRKAAQSGIAEPTNDMQDAKKKPAEQDKPGISPIDMWMQQAKSAPVAQAVSGGVSQGLDASVGQPTATVVETGLDSMLGAPKPGENEALSERLKNVQRKLLLEDLMVNDPVLSEEDPQVVANAYSSVLKMAPEVAANKEVVRAILRQVVHSVAIGSFDAQSWTDLEKNLRNVSGKVDAKGRPIEGVR